MPVGPLILIHYILLSLPLFRTNTQILLGLLQFGHLALLDQQLLLEVRGALEEVVVGVLEAYEDCILLFHVALEEGYPLLHFFGLFFLSEQLGLEFVHLAVLVEECEMQT